MRLKVKAECFGAEWAAGQDQEHFEGEIDRWHTVGNILYIKWEGWTRYKQAPLDSLLEDENGASLELTLLPYDDGRAPPGLHIESCDNGAATGGGGGGGGGNGGQNDGGGGGDRPAGRGGRGGRSGRDTGATEGESVDEEGKAEVVVHGQSWTKLEPEGVRTDQRTQPRQKPKIISEAVLENFEDYFHHFLPPAWYDIIMKFTNPKLLNTHKVNQKLTKGRLLRWIGYALCFSVHKGTAIEKMWATQPEEEQSMPAPAFGRHGMTKDEWRKIFQLMSFGPSDDDAFDADEWCFVAPVLDAFNEHTSTAYHPGWMLTCDESMVAWKGQTGESRN